MSMLGAAARKPSLPHRAGPRGCPRGASTNRNAADLLRRATRHLLRRVVWLFGGASGMLAGLNDGGVDEDVAKSALSRQRREDPMPRAGARPALKELVRAVPRAELRREITSRTADARNSQHRLDEQAVVRRAAPGIVNLARGQVLDSSPLCICKLLPHRASNPSNGLGLHC
jgi:hypothetical protein